MYFCEAKLQRVVVHILVKAKYLFFACVEPPARQGQKKIFCQGQNTDHARLYFDQAKIQSGSLFCNFRRGEGVFFSAREVVLSSVFVIQMRGEYIFASDNCHVFWIFFWNLRLQRDSGYENCRVGNSTRGRSIFVHWQLEKLPDTILIRTSIKN